MIREKVMKGLEFHLEKDNCNGCPYNENSNSFCSEKLLQDARTLLTENLPHLLNYEDVLKMCDHGVDCFWCEARHETGVGPYISRWVHPFVYTEDKVLCDVFGNTCYVNLFKGDYNVLWRAWNARPTDEERFAAKWQQVII